MTTKIVLAVVGALAELGGILILAAPDLVPWARRFSVWLDQRMRPFENRVRRWLRLPPRAVLHTAGVGAAVAAGASVTGVVSTSNEGTLEEKVAFLLRRDQHTQKVLAALSERVASVEQEVARHARDLRDEFRREITEGLQAAAEADRPLRLIGAFLLVVGLVCVTAASFL